MREIIFLALITWATLVQSLSFSCREEATIIPYVGVTSLLRCRHEGANHVDLFVGTKRGKLEHVQYAYKKMESLGDIHNEKTDSKPFPIFSMASTNLGTAPDEDETAISFQLFCGGGDRYISIWQQEQPNSNWTCSQHLGPHTGWVKDVLFDHHHDLLHSIGCNCIESWKRQENKNTKGSIWTHAAKRSIESSLEEGATLSGDLLCLCDSGEVDSFYSGGVDGRIHAWSHDLTVKDPLYSIGAHNGRINAMKYSYATCLLISAGNDGTIQCRGVSNGQKLQIIPDAHTTLFDANGMTKRVTALVLLQDSSTHIYFAAGTVNGELAFFEVVVNDDTVAIIERSDARFCVSENPVINDLCSLKPSKESDSTWSLVVGHSLGLTLVTAAFR
mmetsp:Transcript_13640/g.24704  ORF Transcript_13640/g.24704 Transcript_13640/m.24704 type:complete len:388 (+) Transcript_13640:309-1472(+)